MATPLWRLELGDNGARWYGLDDGSGRAAEEYGTELLIRRSAVIFREQGYRVVIECRESSEHPWKAETPSPLPGQLELF